MQKLVYLRKRGIEDYRARRLRGDFVVSSKRDTDACRQQSGRVVYSVSDEKSFRPGCLFPYKGYLLLRAPCSKDSGNTNPLRDRASFGFAITRNQQHPLHGMTRKQMSYERLALAPGFIPEAVGRSIDSIDGNNTLKPFPDGWQPIDPLYVRQKLRSTCNPDS